MSSKQRDQLAQYVNLILEVGLNLRRNQRLLILHSSLYGVDVQLAPFVWLIAEAAYAHGAAMVDVVWGDPQLELLRLQKAPADTLGEYPRWPSAARIEHVQAGDALLLIRADDPDLLANVDPRLVAPYLAGIRTHLEPIAIPLSNNAINWCVVAASLGPWAARVLPDVPAQEQEARLWQLIFSINRVGGDDPVSSWRKHLAELAARSTYLTGKQYSSLVYTGPGTHLKVGLPPGHLWKGGQIEAGNGITFVPNLPTEEVFTLPHCAAVEGQVTATRPFDYGGSTIDGMTLTFAGGKVVRFAARTGEDILREMLQTDEGGSRLGEVSLVPHSSPISQSGVIFHSILFDENAASHLALGHAYRFTLKDAEVLSDEEFRARGGNASKVHTDFMIGSGALDVDGLLPGGQSEPVMRAGEWAFDV